MRIGALLAAAVVPALAACGADDPAPGLSAPEDAAKGERVDIDAFVDAIAASFDQEASAKVRFEVKGPTPLTGRGVVEYDADGMDVDIQLRDWQVEGGTVKVRTVGQHAYMQVPESQGLWVDLGSEDAGLADTVLQEADPRGQTERLRETITEVRFSGEDTVDDVPARRYQVLTEPSGDESAGSDAAGAPDVTEYWFDESGRIIQRSNSLEGGSALFTWVDWEAGVDIAEPSAGRVITIERLDQLRREQGK